jgi:hypothetical protein
MTAASSRRCDAPAAFELYKSMVLGFGVCDSELVSSGMKYSMRQAVTVMLILP